MSQFLSYLLMPLQALAITPRKLLAMSLPARVAMLVAVFLVICVVTAYAAFYFSQNRTPWELWWRPGRMAVIGLLVIVIPLVVYQALRLWLEGEASRFPDIDYAWNAGVAELARNGLQLTEIPIFLIIGSTGEALERSLFNASRQSFRVKEFPSGPAALHWYGGPDAIYLCCSDVGQLSKLAALGEKAGNEPTGSVAMEAAPAPGGDIRGTIMAGAEPAPQPSIAASGLLPQPPAAGAGGGIRGTMMIGQMSMSLDDLKKELAKNLVSLLPQDANEQRLRLEYLCRLLRRGRQTLCPINGLLTLLPYGVIQCGPREGTEVERAVKGDMTTLHHSLKLRCPATAMVVGLDRENGFRELVRRVGAERSRGQRFGKGFGVWNPPSPEQMEAVCAHACGAFEDWVYTLFREPGSLSKPGNTKLYALLCKIRRNVQSRLASVLVSGFGDSPDPAQRGDGLLFGGCYFAAAGEQDDRQAFVKGVLDKLPEQQEELEWTSAAIREEQRNRQIASVFWAIDALLLVALGGMIVYKLTN